MSADGTNHWCLSLVSFYLLMEEKKKAFLMLFWSWTWCKNQADLSSSSLLMLTIFSVETWGRWHVSSICMKSPVCRAGDRPWLSLCRAPVRYLAQPQPVEQTVSMQSAPIPFAGLDPLSHTGPGRSWGGLCSHKDNSTRTRSPCLLKHCC